MSYNVFKNTRSHKGFLRNPLNFIRKKRVWISATQTSNYMIDDTLVDWLKKYRSKTRVYNNLDKDTSFNNYLFECGNKFEKDVVKYLNDNSLQVVKNSEKITDSTVKKTEELMRLGVPIIHSAPVKNKYNSTKGVIDLLVRSDYIQYIVKENPLKENEINIHSPKLNKNYYYIPIDIKFSTLKLKSDGVHLLNTGRIPAYKAQLCIYNDAICHIQGYKSRYAFILGRRWVYTQKGDKYSGNIFNEKLGKIDFVDIDKEYTQKTKNAISWLRKLDNEGHKWTVSPPSIPELYPNMSIDSGKWQKVKKNLAIKNNELTLIWNVGIKNRKNAFLNNITNWKDKRCNSNILSVGGKRRQIVDDILAINRQDKIKILPENISSQLFSWRDTTDNELFVDFETTFDIFSDYNNFPHQPKCDQIFMIGVGYIEKNKWKYINFTCKKLTPEEEYRIMDDFVKFLQKRNNPKIWYWCAEKKFWNLSSLRQYDYQTQEEKMLNITYNWNLENMCDLQKIFKSQPIVIKDCFNYSLKDIAKKMHEYKMISTKLQSNTQNGSVAAIKAWEIYNSNSSIENSPIIKDILQYNEFDCKVLYDILKYFRKNK